jgi:aminoglycoside phosphotransferase (APT) family kinase protein
MAARLSPEELAAALGTHLGGAVHGLRRLSGGASRSTSAFDLIDADGASVPLVVQVDRGDADQGVKMRTERALLDAARAAGVPVPTVVALGDGTDGDPVGAGWLVVERLDGETIPRKILRDHEWAEARHHLGAQCGQALAAVHAIEPD